MTQEAQIVDNVEALRYGADTRKVAEIGRVIVQSEKFRKMLAEKGIELSEDLTLGNNTALYTTAVAAIIEEALKPTLVMNNVVRTLNDFKNKPGFDSVKIPKETLFQAADLTENAVIPAETANYAEVTVNLKWVGARSRISYELLRTAAVDLISERLKAIGQAIARKLDSDIIAAIEAKVDTVNNTNRIVVDNTTAGQEVTYSTLMDAISMAESNDAKPDTIVVHPTIWNILMKDADVKQALAFGTRPEGSVIPVVQEFAGLRVLKTTQVANNALYVIDSQRLGYYIPGTDVETFDGRIAETIAHEVIGAQKYGIGITNELAFVKIERI